MTFSSSAVSVSENRLGNKFYKPAKILPGGGSIFSVVITLFTKYIQLKHVQPIQAVEAGARGCQQNRFGPVQSAGHKMAALTAMIHDFQNWFLKTG